VNGRLLVAVAASALLAGGVAACGGGNDDNSASASSGGGPASGGTINGAGATFPQPVYSEWASRFKDATGTTVNYQGIGSGGGIAQFTERTIDFGASDAPMTDAEIAAAKKRGDPVHVPTVLGAVTVSYNLSGVDTGLKLDGPTVADIFLGRIKAWNDAAIKKLNPGVNLPSEDISVCHRSDESGTTFNFTLYLSDVSAAWKNGPGNGKSVKWPTGTGAKGNNGVAGCVKQTEGAVGYVEQAYALANNFTTASVKNKAGDSVAPSLKATSAAGAGASPPPDLRFETIDASGAQSYPITAVTFLLVYQDMCKAGLSKTTAIRVKAWLDYALGAGQKVAPQLEYAPLPASIRSKAQQKVNGLQCNGRAIRGS
jgi:phosphate transport system substrate-binding protein